MGLPEADADDDAEPEGLELELPEPPGEPDDELDGLDDGELGRE